MERKLMKIGDKYGRLTVIAEAEPIGPRKLTAYRFRCDCGNEIVRPAYKVRSGHTKSCGCYHDDRSSERMKELNGRYSGIGTGKYKKVGVGRAGVRVQRIVAERMLGRKLARGESVHHIDGNRENNDPSNLVVMTSSEHVKLHWKLRKQAHENKN